MEPSTLRESITRLRAIPAKWKHLADPIGEIMRIREDPEYDLWADPQWATQFMKCREACKCDVPTRPRADHE